MSRRGLQGQAAELLYAAEVGDRFVDLQIRLTEWDGETDIMTVGGRWDRESRCWSDEPAETEVHWKVQPAQYEVAYWFRDWLSAYVRGERLEGFEDIFVAMLEGGRRAGKSDFGVRAAVMMAIAMPNRIVWNVTPVQDGQRELKDVMDGLLEPGWYQYLEKNAVYRIWNGTEIYLKSAYVPAQLKQGRCDLWLFNEPQNMNKIAYLMARPALSDTSGLGILACNPPNTPKGRWVGEMHDQVMGGEVKDVKLFQLDNRLNPKVNWRSLEVMRATFGDDDYRREVLGEFVPVGDRVWYGWSDAPGGNVRPLPDIGDVTEEFTRRHFGRPYARFAGLDFQLSPHMAAAGAHAFRLNPDDVRDSLIHYASEAAVEGTEDDLIDEMLAIGWTPEDTVLIADASGEWQDGERTKGRASFDRFRARGWRIYVPDQHAKRNPLISERVLGTNALIRASDATVGLGGRRLFSVRECVNVCRAMKHWENRNGIPNRRSEFAHFSDAVSYPICRFFPRRTKRDSVEVRRGKPKKSARARDLELL